MCTRYHLCLCFNALIKHGYELLNHECSRYHLFGVFYPNSFPNACSFVTCLTLLFLQFSFCISCFVVFVYTDKLKLSDMHMNQMVEITMADLTCKCWPARQTVYTCCNLYIGELGGG